MTIAYRPSTETEWSSAHDLTRDNMATYYRASGRTWDTGIFRDSWPTTENFTLEISGSPVGFLRLSQTDKTLWVRDLQITTAAQGQGVGTFALVLTEQIARERGANELRLRAFEDNPAIRLYLKHGFRRVGRDGPLVTFSKRAHAE